MEDTTVLYIAIFILILTSFVFLAILYNMHKNGTGVFDKSLPDPPDNTFMMHTYEPMTDEEKTKLREKAKSELDKLGI